VLLIGVDQRVNTTYHTAEEQMVEPYQLTDDLIPGVVVVDGNEILVWSRLHVWRYHPNFNVLNPELEELGYLTRGRVGDAATMCLDAKGFVDLALQKLRQAPGYFLTDQTALPPAKSEGSQGPRRAVAPID
jgi:aminoglycoside N3'-acetyltransferase